MQRLLRPNLTATMLAGVPYRDTHKAVETILNYFPEAPCLPVMTRSIRWMLEGIPCLLLDRNKRRVYFELSTQREQELIEFYDRYEADDLDFFATTSNTAPWFYALLEELKKAPPVGLKWVAFQSSGSVVLSDIVRQLDEKSSFYNPTLRDILTKGINMKSRWLEKKIKEELPDVEVIVGLAATTLVNFTSAAGCGSRKEILDALNGGFEKLDGLKWVHCCANIDWSLLFDSNVDVINFDAYQYADRILLYHDELKEFLKNGGMIGWGIVPVIGEALQKEKLDSLAQRIEKGIGFLVQKGIDEKLLLSSSWILPSCETIMLTLELSEMAFDMTHQISELLRERYGLKAD